MNVKVLMVGVCDVAMTSESSPAVGMPVGGIDKHIRAPPLPPPCTDTNAVQACVPALQAAMCTGPCSVKSLQAGVHKRVCFMRLMRFHHHHYARGSPCQLLTSGIIQTSDLIVAS